MVIRNKKMIQGKIYKYKKALNNSSLRAVTIFPGNRKVAGCLFFCEGFFNG